MDTRSIEITVKLASGKLVTSEIDIHYSLERNYGADADGNRGMDVTFCDGFTIHNTEFADDDSMLSADERVEAESLLEQEADKYI